MRFLKRILKTNPKGEELPENSDVQFDPSVLRQNNITRLSIDERWTKLFVTIKMSPELEQAEKEMNELIKKEAMLKNEQDNLEPQKRRKMQEIMNLTQEAFENDNEEAKKRLVECKKEIERINIRMNNILEDIENIDAELKEANLKLLKDSLAYIFTTLKTYRSRTLEIKAELEEMERRRKALTEELENISFDWTKYAVDLTELIGTDEVKRLEAQFGLEELKDETADTSTDEGN